MSRHPSPGPSISHPQQPTLPRQKQKPYSIGIAAGAEDVKYQAKYKELKRKVKEIESDNDKLNFKILQAKRSIQRMKLERAILYERLSAVPPSPDVHDRLALPSVHSGPGVPPGPPPALRAASGSHHLREIRDHPAALEPEHTLVDYPRGHGRVGTGVDSRPVPVMETPMGPGVAPSHSLSAIHSPRRTPSGSALDHRHLPPLQHLPPVQQLEGSRSHPHSNSHASPPLHHSHIGSSHERSHSHSSSRRSHQSSAPNYHSHPQQYPDNLPPVQHVLHSPALSERERSRRHEMHEMPPSHGDPHNRSMTQLSPRAHSSDSRSSSRIHSHQRMGPGTYINREDPQERGRDRHIELERERERDREREWEQQQQHRNRDLGRIPHSPPSLHRSRQQMDKGDYHDQQHHTSSRNREESLYYHDVPASSGYPRMSRSGTPGSGSGSTSGVGGGEVPSRPDSRTQFYEHERTRSYRLRPVNQPNEDLDFVHEDGRSHSRDRTGGAGVGAGAAGSSSFQLSEQSRSMESRKRTRNDMEVDMEKDGEGSTPGGGPVYSTGRLHEDRSTKRYHRAAVDNQDDDRMGPP